MIFVDFFLAVLGIGLGILITIASGFLLAVAVMTWLDRGDDK